MEDIKLIASSIFLLVVVVYAIVYGPKNLKKQLTPLLSFIEGRVYLKYRGWMVTILEGIWQGVRVKVEIKNMSYSSDIYITFFSSCTWPFSLKVRPTSSSFGLVDMHLGTLADGHRLKIPEAKITVYSPAGDEAMIRQFLNPARLAIIQDIFSHKLNYLEIHTDPIAGDYLKVGIEGCRLSNSQKACKAAIKLEVVSHILEQLKEFSNADKNRTGMKHQFSKAIT